MIQNYSAGKRTNGDMMLLSRSRTPYAIWFQSIPGYQASISLVNDLYRYEIFEQATGDRIAMGSRGTLARAKADVFTLFEGVIS